MEDIPEFVTVAGYRGVAFRVLEGDGETLKCRMVGDDRDFEFSTEECTVLSEDEFCFECGQIGCGHWRQPHEGGVEYVDTDFIANPDGPMRVEHK